MTPRRTLLASTIVLLLVCAGDARADEQAQGRVLFDEGVALSKDGHWAEACPKFEASLKHFPGLGTRGKLAECYEKLGRYASAWQLWRDVAQLAMRAGEPTREQVASEHAKALEPKLSYITVVVTPSSDVAGLVVKRDGAPVDRAKLGGAEPIDAGSVTFEVSAPNRKSFSAQVTVTPGQSARFEVPVLEPSASATATPVPTPAPSASSTTAPGYFPPPETEHTPWQKPTGLVLAGVGVVGIAIGSVVGLSAKSKYDKAFEAGGGCDKATNQCDAPGQQSMDDARSSATLSTILFIAGGALVAGGAVLYLTAPSVKKSGLRIVPTGYASGAGLAIAGGL